MLLLVCVLAVPRNFPQYAILVDRLDRNSHESLVLHHVVVLEEIQLDVVDLNLMLPFGPSSLI